MTTTTRNTMLGFAVALATVGFVRLAAAKEAVLTMNPVIARIRATTPTLNALIAEATERSATFRNLVDTIHTSDGIVYVEPGQCGHGAQACLMSVTAAGPTRILWVRVDTRMPDRDLMGSIGHELRHAVEVLSTPSVTSHSAMVLFYLREGFRESNRFETRAAIQAGDAVREEIRHRPR